MRSVKTNTMTDKAGTADRVGLDPQAEMLLSLAEAIELPDLSTLSAPAARELYDLQTADIGSTSPLGSVSNHVIPGPGGDLAIRVYTPVPGNPDSAEQPPTLMYFHGGGWVLGNLETHDVVCRALCENVDAAVVSVEYRLAPEDPFPAAPDDCETATRWVVENADSIGVDASRLALCGDSAGGNLAAVVAQRFAVDGPKVAAQVLIYPSTDLSDLTRPSLKRNSEGYLLTEAAMKWFYSHYITDPDDVTNPSASPMLGELSGQPPALVITAEFDPLLDDGRAYADALRTAGVDVEYVEYPGQIHTFFTQVGLIDDSLHAVRRVGTFLNTKWTEISVQ